MHIKKGDNVIVLTGKDKGKKGKVLQVIPGTNRVVVDGVNIFKKHQRKTRNDVKGQIIDVTRSMHASNVQPIDPKLGKATRVGVKMVSGKRVRVAQKSGQEL